MRNTHNRVRPPQSQRIDQTVIPDYRLVTGANGAISTHGFRFGSTFTTVTSHTITVWRRVPSDA